MFNTPLKLSNIVDQHKYFLEDEFEVFTQMIVGGKIVNKDEAFVHIEYLCQIDKLRYHLSRSTMCFSNCK